MDGIDLLLAAADQAAGPHTGDGDEDDLDELGLEAVAMSEGGAAFSDGGRLAASLSLSPHPQIRLAALL